jgi:Domain of unknown function (DU1801)
MSPGRHGCHIHAVASDHGRRQPHILCEDDGMATRKSPAMRPTDAPVAEFLARVPDEQRREDARRLCAVMRDITGEPPVMWGASIVGFGLYHYRYASGREGDSPLAGFSPRRQYLAIYLIGEFESRHRSALARLGPYRTGKGCLYIRRLDRVDPAALRELIDRSVRVRQGIDRASIGTGIMGSAMARRPRPSRAGRWTRRSPTPSCTRCEPGSSGP